MKNFASGQRSLGPADVALELRHISKRFGAITALDEVSIRVTKGTVHALLGENGAGKTTLMRIAFGLIRPDSGSIVIDGKPMVFTSPADAIGMGIGMVHQQFAMVPAMSVAENIALGGHGRYSFNRIAQRLDAVAKTTGLSVDPAASVATLSSADRQKLEIVRAFTHEARILILDEPTAVLVASDIRELFAQLKKFASHGGSVILITHKIEDALQHADIMTVLRRGRLATTASTHDSTRNSLLTAMLGVVVPDAGVDKPSRSIPSHQVISLKGITIRGLHGKRQIHNASAEVQAGEIVGVAALEGDAAGLLRVIAGRAITDSGQVSAPPVVGFVPENRQEDALAPFSLLENVALKDAGRRTGLIDWRKIRELTASIIHQFDVRGAQPSTPVPNLSGGNQQRFVLGRELENHPAVLVLENPTQGLDIAATTAIHARMRDARNRGTAIVFYSSDLDELAELSDRVLVIEGGAIQSVAPDRDRIGKLLLGMSRKQS